MKWHKNLGAKLAVVPAGLTALLGSGAFIRQNPPPNAAAAGAMTDTTAAGVPTPRTTTQQPASTQITRVATHADADILT